VIVFKKKIILKFTLKCKNIILTKCNFTKHG